MGESTSEGGTDYSGRIQDKRSRAEARSRDLAYERSKRAEFGPRSKRGKNIDYSGSQMKTVTQSRTELAERDLDRRATDGQISQRNQDNLRLGAVNEFGKSRAKDIQGKIAAGGTRVYDESGRIQGVVHTSNTLFGPQQVYTGSASYAPKDTGAKIGTITGARDGTKGYQTGNRNVIGGMGESDSVPVMKNTTGSTLSSTKMNNAAVRQARVASLGAGGGGANRRKFV